MLSGIRLLIRIRIHNSHWIWIQYGSRSTTPFEWFEIAAGNSDMTTYNFMRFFFLLVCDTFFVYSTGTYMYDFTCTALVCILLTCSICFLCILLLPVWVSSMSQCCRHWFFCYVCLMWFGLLVLDNLLSYVDNLSSSFCLGMLALTLCIAWCPSAVWPVYCLWLAW
jgi:hypothetical protein